MCNSLCNSRLLLLVAALSIAPAHACGQQYDQVLTRRGSPANGRVVGMSPTEVVLETRGTRQRIAVNEIRRVSYAEDTPELRRGRDNILAGQWAAGVADLERVDAASLDRAEVKQDLQFYLAYGRGRLALTSGGDKSTAKNEMLAFAVNWPESFHFLQAADLLGDLALALDEDAVKYYAAIAAKAPWPEYKLEAAISEAQALLLQRKYGEADRKFTEAMQFQLDTPEATRQVRLAQVGRAVALAETDRHEEARQILERLIAENDPQDSELFGRAYNALGRCFLKAQRPRDALLAYLHVDILFFAEPEEHAEALYHLSQLWSAVQKPDRAQSARNLLNDRYAGTRWARQ
jgi:tetratricopeptide (TPR) repeat protein